MKMNSKKGQLTIFIIVGIVLLFSAALIIFIRQSITQYKPPIEVTIEQVPTELQPLQQYITKCISDVAKEGIKKAGIQGGYLDSSKLVVDDTNPTESEGISLSPGGDVKVPYWYYMKSSNNCDSNCQFSSKQPMLYRTTGTGDSLEEQMDKYVEQRLSSCIGDFSPFKSQGFDVKQTSVHATTTIAKTEVFVQVDYPLTVTKDGREEKLSKFIARVPVNFGKFYDLATELTQKEQSYGYLENVALNLIEVYSGVNEKKLPPLADTTFDSTGFKRWILSDVKNNVEQLLAIHSQAFQAAGTSNFQGNFYTGSNQLAQGLYGGLFILPLNHTYTSSAQFSYLPWWPSYLAVSPSKGELISPDTSSNLDQFLSSIHLNQYRFTYDLSYPVLISLSDPSALDGEGFVFQFALEANLRNNAVMKSDTTLISFSGRPSQSLVCNPENFKSGEVTLDLSDSITEKPVDQADVYFSFGNEACFMGQTHLEKGKAILKTKMPVGIGSLVISKEDYLSRTIPFSASLDEKQEVEATIDPYVNVNVSVSRIPVVKKGANVAINAQGINPNSPQSLGSAITVSPNWELLSEIPDLEFTQNAIVTFSRISESKAQQSFISNLNIKGNGNRTQTIRLVPGSYQITGNLLDNRKTVIPEDKVCYPDDWYDAFGLGKDKCTTIPSIQFNIFPKGGVSIASFEISPSTLRDNRNLVIPLFSAPDGYKIDANGNTNLKHEDLGQLGKIEQYSRDHFELIKPRFSK